MNKNFTAEDIIKKHETNIKSAATVILLSGVLGLIYVVRFFFKGDFNFYFSLSFTDMLLKSGNENGNIIVPSIISVIYIVAYLSLSVLSNKNTKLLTVAAVMYLFDFSCLIGSLIFIYEKPLDPACFIDVIMHLFILIFFVVGVKSAKALRSGKAEKQ
ncbi:MAG: hypothetical protein IJ491_10070 [Clostridia bacterium]|nr:hypothetical protein [Clostridia bacterium]